jgi:hypothetical protein
MATLKKTDAVRILANLDYPATLAGLTNYAEAVGIPVDWGQGGKRATWKDALAGGVAAHLFDNYGDDSEETEKTERPKTETRPHADEESVLAVGLFAAFRSRKGVYQKGTADKSLTAYGQVLAVNAPTTAALADRPDGSAPRGFLLDLPKSCASAAFRALREEEKHTDPEAVEAAMRDYARALVVWTVDHGGGIDVAQAAVAAAEKRRNADVSDQQGNQQERARGRASIEKRNNLDKVTAAGARGEMARLDARANGATDEETAAAAAVGVLVGKAARGHVKLRKARKALDNARTSHGKAMTRAEAKLANAEAAFAAALDRA